MGGGKARVTLSFDAWKAGRVAPATVEVPVYVPKAAASDHLRATLRGLPGRPSALAVASDGRTLAVGSFEADGVKLFDLADRRERSAFRCELGSVRALAFSPDGRTLAVGALRFTEQEGIDGGIELWDVASAQRRAVLRHPAPRAVTNLAFAPDGRSLAAAESVRADGRSGGKQFVTVWDVAGGTVRTELPDEPYVSLAYSPDGRVLARAVIQFRPNQPPLSEIRLRDTATGRELPPLKHSATEFTIQRLAWSPDGRALAGADEGHSVIVWDVAATAVRAVLPQDDSRRFPCLAFSPDGRTLAVGLSDRNGEVYEPGLIALWDVAAGRKLTTLTGHTSGVTAVAFSPDGRTLISASRDRTVRLWDVTGLTVEK